MKVLIKQAHIICPGSPFHHLQKDVLVIEGKIKEISDTINETANTVITTPDLYLSLGWMDIFSHFNDPGFEHKENLESGAAAAAAGGFTDVMVIPNTSPAIASKAQVEYIIHRARSLPVNIHPIAAISKNLDGKELSEMYDMHLSGALAFSDGTNTVQDPGLLLKALQYVTSIGATVIQVPEEKSIAAHGLMHEGITSTKLGLPGKASLAEELMISRDIELLRYTGSKLHITGLSTKKGLQLVENAKAEGLQLTVSVTPFHALFCDEDLQTYDTNLKVNPPLRSREDMMAIRTAIQNRKIDGIASHHFPQHWDDKTCEFEYAQNGMTGLESLFGTLNPLFKDIDAIISLLTTAPRNIFDLQQPAFAVDADACLTLFQPNAEYIFDESMVKSKSRNNPFIGKILKGRVVGIINKNQISLNNL